MVPPHAQHGEGDRPPQAGGGGVTRARVLRRSLSLPEGLLWQRLRRRAGGVKFRRQHPFGPYVLDFYCASARLAVEVDGAAAHASRGEREEVRAQYIEAAGLRLLRVTAAEVLADPDCVADAVARVALPLHHSPAASGTPPRALRREER